MKKIPNYYKVVDYRELFPKSTRLDSFEEALEKFKELNQEKFELQAWFENPDFFIAYHYRYKNGEWIGPF